VGEYHARESPRVNPADRVGTKNKMGGDATGTLLTRKDGGGCFGMNLNVKFPRFKPSLKKVEKR